MKEVGHFKIDGDSVLGPADYMEEQGDAFLNKLLNGGSTVYNYAVGTRGDDPEMALLVALQTDYAGWAGTRGLMRRLTS